MMAAIDGAKEAGDTVGGVVEVVATGVPVGLGSHVHWDRRIDGRIAQALMSINAVKAASIGEGWEAVDMRGSQVHDVIDPVSDPSRPWQRQTNRSGGTEGGMTTGMPLVARFAVKAHIHPGQSLTLRGPGHRAAGPGPLRALGHLPGPPGGGHRGGHGGPGAGRRPSWRSSAATTWRRPAATATPT